MDEHSSRPKETRKSFEVLSTPFVADVPKGRGAGIKPQFPRLILRASAQYFSPTTLIRSMLSADDLKRSAAFRNASSLPPIDSWESKACTEATRGGFVTIAAVNIDEASGAPAG